jgi:hypothetical protein
LSEDDDAPDVAPLETSIKGREFHLEEFKALKAEIEFASARIVRLTQYVLLVSAVAYSVSFGISEKSKVPDQTAILLLFFPLLCSLVGFFVCVRTAFRIRQTGNYISLLEDKMALPGLGWEHHIASHRMAGITTLIPWTAICVLNALIPLLWWRGIIQISAAPALPGG